MKSVSIVAPLHWVVNVASHDSLFDPANIAVIDITSHNTIKIIWKKIASNFELLMKNREMNYEEKCEKLREMFYYALMSMHFVTV